MLTLRFKPESVGFGRVRVRVRVRLEKSVVTLDGIANIGSMLGLVR